MLAHAGDVSAAARRGIGGRDGTPQHRDPTRRDEVTTARSGYARVGGARMLRCGRQRSSPARCTCRSIGGAVGMVMIGTTRTARVAITKGSGSAVRDKARSSPMPSGCPWSGADTAAWPSGVTSADWPINAWACSCRWALACAIASQGRMLPVRSASSKAPSRIGRQVRRLGRGESGTLQW